MLSDQCIKDGSKYNLNQANTWQHSLHTVSQKHCANLILSENSTNFDNFWQGNDKEAEIMQGDTIWYES